MHTFPLRTIPFVCALCLALSAFAQPSERVTIVKLTNEIGEEELRVLTNNEITELQKELMEESRFHMLAVARAQQTWNSEGRKKSFPKAYLDQRRFVRTTSHGSAAEAWDRIKRAEESRERFDEKRKDRQSTQNTNYSSKGAYDASKQKQERDKAKEESKSERQKQAEEALGYYQTALRELKAEALAKAQEAVKKKEGAQP
jgi:hypothetical protein